MAQPDGALPSDLLGGSGDDLGAGTNFDSALDDILGNSNVLSQAGISTKEEQEEIDDNAAEDDQDADESSDEEDDEEGSNTNDEDDDDGDEDDSTEGDDDDEDGDDVNDDAEDEIDYEFKVPVKVDGEESEVDLGELVKGYQTSQHLSKKGRELANERKEFEAERDGELTKVRETAKVLQAQSSATENALAKEYSEKQELLKTAKKDGDKYTADELKDDLEEIQGSYWKARKTREGIEEAIAKQEETAKEKKFAAQVEQFNEEIGDYITDFNEEKATSIREFAISKGIPEEVLSTLADARIIGAINEFMELSMKVQKGTAKRKAAPKRKPTTTKKATPNSVKKKVAQSRSSARIKSGQADENDMDIALDALAGRYFN